jgi:hypothetical protein
VAIIADWPEAAEHRIGWIIFGLVVIAGAIAAWHYARLGLTLSHYDARAHLVVARRVIDSLTPGWRQLGAFWLPLPHLVNLLPVQVNWNFQTGFSAVLISMVALASGLAALSRYVLRHTGSKWMGVAASFAILLNPNVLYLQSTPLTEPLLFGFSLAALLAIDDWVARLFARQTERAGLILAGLVLVRYEGWHRHRVDPRFRAAFTGSPALPGWRVPGGRHSRISRLELRELRSAPADVRFLQAGQSRSGPLVARVRAGQQEHARDRRTSHNRHGRGRRRRRPLASPPDATSIAPASQPGLYGRAAADRLSCRASGARALHGAAGHRRSDAWRACLSRVARTN